MSALGGRPDALERLRDVVPPKWQQDRTMDDQCLQCSGCCFKFARFETQKPITNSLGRW